MIRLSDGRLNAASQSAFLDELLSSMLASIRFNEF